MKNGNPILYLLVKYSQAHSPSSDVCHHFATALSTACPKRISSKKFFGISGSDLVGRV